ncbi:hypothetical protein YPC_3022 [Yersinia pestis biovar Medievalis str. Harbin 35]|nr:hypothetical protein YPC_3022 [Yersinia pestis biovar Medievalis str. Harbin 35]
MTNESTTDGNLNAKSTAYQPVIRYGHADRTDCSAFFGAVTGGSSVGDINLYPDADRQNIMLCRGGYRP